jgi:DNA-binding response OmpR family regulator
MDISPRILIVDDDPEGCLLTSLILRRAGFEIRTLNTGAAALAEVERARPDLVMMDLMMPDMDGLKLCRLLRARYGREELPIVIYTARAGADSRQAGIGAGAQDVMIKPTPTAELVSRIKAAIAYSKALAPV